MGLTVVPGNMIEDGTVTDSNFTNTTITSTDMAVDPRNASNISSGSVPLAQLGNVPAIDYTGIEDDIALLGFKAAANGSLAKYNLLDQTVDAFEDASGVDAGSSTNEIRNASKYYSGSVVGSYTVTPFTSTGSATWTCPTDVIQTEVLTVAGAGGGAGYYMGGGGGSGGIVHDTDYVTVPTIIYDLTIGAGGGGGGATTDGTTGSDTVFNVNAEGGGLTLTAKGGGGGRAYGAPDPDGLDGGSGGGSSAQFGNTASAGSGGSSIQASFSGATSYGNTGGGNITAQNTEQAASGGGGAGEVGNTDKQPINNEGGAGGDGLLFSNFTSYGVSGYFAGGGGGGGGYQGSPKAGGTGGTGGGGNGANYNATAAVAGTVNTGSGGGGGSSHIGTPSTSSGAAGGSGFIGLRYRTEVYNNMTLVSTATAAQAAPTKGDIVFTYTNGAGTAVINTNITAEISADGGSTWTAFTLASQGTTGGHTILTSHDQTITSTITAPWNMRYRIKTLVQSASMDTRIQAVSLGWS